jgi:hypothetical protein
MDIHNLPIGERIDWLMEHARTHSASYSSPESSMARTRYLAEHPTDLVVLKCMDGRVNLSVATNTPQGIINPLRNLGGYFDLGWPHMSEVLSNHLQGVIAEGRRSMIMISYHYSKGSPDRGCAGFNYDIEAAKNHTLELKCQVEQLFGPGHSIVYPLVCGFETDEDALILHGSNGDTLDVSTLGSADTDSLLPRLELLLPDMSVQMQRDLLPLVKGNIEHIQKGRDQLRELESVHREWTICVGHVYDFLQIPNLALIIGPYSPDLGEPVRKAAGIIQNNMLQGRIPDDGFLLLTSAPYREVGLEMERAKLNSRFLSDFAARQIVASHPELARKMHIRTAVMNWQTRDLSLLD